MKTAMSSENTIFVRICKCIFSATLYFTIDGRKSVAQRARLVSQMQAYAAARGRAAGAAGITDAGFSRRPRAGALAKLVLRLGFLIGGLAVRFFFHRLYGSRRR